VLLGVLTWVLFGDPAILRGPVVGILMGVASGAAMLPYSVIKEANPPELGGSATGVINFINFTFSALLGPVFGSRLVQAPGADDVTALEHYQAGFEPLLYGIVLALVLTCLLKETGSAVRIKSVSARPSC
jgi:MFS family permease